MKRVSQNLALRILLLIIAPTAVAIASEGLKKLSPRERARLVNVEEAARQERLDGSEIITERYADGQIKIERSVIRDLADKQVSHGSWKKFDQHGNMIVEGQYRDGLRHGVWNAWYRAREAALFDQQPFRQFEGPFISQATFADGRLDGAWTIYDRKQRKIAKWTYRGGLRHGVWQWWLPNGNKMQELTYVHGVADGTLKQFDGKGKVVASIHIEDGRRFEQRSETFDNGKRRSSTGYLLARRIPTGKDVWSKLQLAPYKTEGDDIKHGVDRSWYSNGKPRQIAHYEQGVESGEFTWWNKAGQMLLEGKYVDGQRHGLWTWWHDNGKKSIEGYFEAGRPVDRWVYWSPEGKVLRETEKSPSQGVVRRQRSEDKTAKEASDDSDPQDETVWR
ncbi:MAG: hypothetical protein MI757_00550 [Pirellulales bacterium]|nr:hypothetical protein [Pirellulales bacterium]